jgi:hypothetical protein
MAWISDPPAARTMPAVTALGVLTGALVRPKDETGRITFGLLG